MATARKGKCKGCYGLPKWKRPEVKIGEEEALAKYLQGDDLVVKYKNKSKLKIA